MKIKIRNVIYLLAVVFFMAACSHDVSFENSAEEEFKNKTYFCITSTNVRSVLPVYNIDSFSEYSLKGKLEGVETDFGTYSTFNNLKNKKFEIEEGEWIFYLTAKKYETVYTATTAQTIVKGKNSISFELKMEKLDLENGKGIIQFVLNVPASVTKVQYSLVEFYTGAVVSAFDSVEIPVVSGKAVFNAQDVASGTYYINAVLLNENEKKLNTYKTVASVCDEVVSKGEFTITSVNPIYSITYAPGHYTFTPGYVLPASYTKYDTEAIILPVKENIHTALQFLGWYLTSDCSGEAVTEILPAQKENIILYPKWGNELTCSVDELTEYITDFENTEIIVHITDEYPSLYSIKSCLNANKTVNVRLDLDACERLDTIFNDFRDSENLVSISIPKNVISLGNYTFYDCVNLKEINYNAINISAISSYSGSWLNANTGKNNGGVTINIGEQVEIIPENFLSNQKCVKKLNFANSSTCKKIGASAFYGVLALEEITLGENLQTIGDSAFRNCANLKTVRVDNPSINSGIGGYAFFNTKIEDIYFAGTLLQWLEFCEDDNPINCNTETGSNLYLNNKLLTEVVLNDEDSTFNGFAYRNIKSISSITIGEDVSSIYIKAGIISLHGLKNFYYNAKQCEGYSSLSEYFGDLKGSEEGVTITIGNKVKKIPAKFFYGRTNSNNTYSNIIFKDGSECTEIGSQAFYNINAMNVYYDKGLKDWYSLITFVDKNSNPLFRGESNLYVNKNELVETLEFPEGTTALTMNRYAFAGCKSLKKVIIPETVTSIAENLIEDAYYVEELDYNPIAVINFKNSSNCFNCMGLYSENGLKMVIGDKVTKVPDYFNRSKIYVTELDFKENSVCKEIGVSAFETISTLKKITIPENIEKIGDRAFAPDEYTASHLEEINYNARNSGGREIFYRAGKSTTDGITLNIGPNVETIGSNCFRNANITSVNFASSKIKAIGNEAFLGTSVKTVKYPGTEKQWQSITFGNETFSSGVREANPCCAGADLYINGILLTEASFESDVTEIPLAVYSGVKSITKITIPEHITKINNYAFYKCINVTQLNFKAVNCEVNGTDIFYQFGSNTEGVVVNIGSQVTKIPNNMFGEKTTNISEINFPENGVCSTIGHEAFWGSSKLTTIIIPSYIKEFEYGAFKSCPLLHNVYYKGTKAEWESITFGDDVSSPCCNGASLYLNGTKVTSVSFTEGTTETPVGTYSGCVDITSVTLPSTLKKINSFTFTNCTGLISITIPEGVEEILKKPFYGCTGLSEINYNAVKLITNTSYPGDMFRNVGQTSSTGACTVNFGAKVTEIPSDLFRSSNTTINQVNFAENSELKVIKDDAFYCMKNLTQINIPATVSEIGDCAFYGTGLTSVAIPDSVTTLGSQVFRRCEDLETVIIGSGITRIEDYTFIGSQKLSSVTFRDTNNWYKSTSISYKAFEDQDRIDVSNPSENASLLSEGDYYLFKKQ